ncbi:hypothetical protein NX059_008198 [Plenodomus lindquistii]|nr:hypothetical protein NX059_008198 [Plenodomus lindquistii]
MADLPKLKLAQDFDAILRPKQIKSMAELDKEEEAQARLAMSQREKVKSVGKGVLGWVVGIGKKG